VGARIVGIGAVVAVGVLTNLAEVAGLGAQVGGRWRWLLPAGAVLALAWVLLWLWWRTLRVVGQLVGVLRGVGADSETERRGSRG